MGIKKKQKKTDVWPLSHFEKGIEADKFSTLFVDEKFIFKPIGGNLCNSNLTK